MPWSRTPRLPQHLTADLSAGLRLWSAEPRRLDFEADKIAKESEEVPLQFAPSRTIGGSLKFRF